jgi:peptidyl-dipeptidase Dcp
MTSNPFLQDWQTPFEVPPFADISAEHYGPALDQAFEEHLAEVEAIASNTDPVTFANTIDALELAGELLRKTSAVFYNLAGSHTNDALQALERELAPKMAKHSQAVSLHEGLFARIEALWAIKDTLDLTAEQTRVLDLTRKGLCAPGPCWRAPSASGSKRSASGLQFLPRSSRRMCSPMNRLKRCT